MKHLRFQIAYCAVGPTGMEAQYIALDSKGNDVHVHTKVRFTDDRAPLEPDGDELRQQREEEAADDFWKGE